MAILSELKQADFARQIEAIFQRESGRVLATLIGRLGDFALAEDSLQDGFLKALERWPDEGIPPNPAAWLLTVARNGAIDRLRRAATLARKQTLLQTLAEDEYQEVAGTSEDSAFPDERLKLIFTCCHPALKEETRVALTLHTLGGLTTAQIAGAFLVPETTMAQRLVRAKRKIKEAGIPYAVPQAGQLAERWETVLAVIYLIFNAGYSAGPGDTLIRHELCAEAIRLGRALLMLLEQEPALRKLAEPETLGLLALMLLHDSRRAARTGPAGELVVLEEQDRSLWNTTQIQEGISLVERALVQKAPGSYQLQAAISALHAEAATAAETDWFQIAMLYGELIKLHNSPVIRLNWAVAVAMATTPQRGLSFLSDLEADSNMQDYHLFHAARADLLRRAGDLPAAQSAYRQALALTQNSVEQEFLQRRLAQIQTQL